MLEQIIKKIPKADKFMLNKPDLVNKHFNTNSKLQQYLWDKSDNIEQKAQKAAKEFSKKDVDDYLKETIPPIISFSGKVPGAAIKTTYVSTELAARILQASTYGIKDMYEFGKEKITKIRNKPSTNSQLQTLKTRIDSKAPSTKNIENNILNPYGFVAYKIIKPALQISEIAGRKIASKIKKPKSYKPNLRKDLAVVALSTLMAYNIAMTPIRTTNTWNETNKPITQELYVENINNFKNEEWNGLLLAANGAEYQGIFADFERKKRQETYFRDLQINRTNGTIQKGNITLKVVKNGDPIPELERGYNFLQPRGHDAQMNELIEKILPYKAENAYIHVGGCSSTNLINKYTDEKTAITARRGVNETAFNNYFAITTPRDINRASSWEDFKNISYQHAPRIANGYIFPNEQAITKLVQPTTKQRIKSIKPRSLIGL